MSKFPSSFSQETNSIQVALSQPETEESWDAIAKAIVNLEHVIEAYSSTSSTEITSCVRNLYRPLTSAMNSERTRLSGTAINLLAVLASTLGRSFESLVPLFVPSLLALCARPNKVFITRARTCMLTIIETTQLPSLLPHLLQSLRNKSVSLRLTAMECILACLNCFNPPDLEKEARVQDIETAIRLTVRDANPEVRKLSRKVFEAYKVLLPTRVNKFVTPLSPTMKKYLDVQVKPSVSLVMPKRQPGSSGMPLSSTAGQHKAPRQELAVPIATALARKRTLSAPARPTVGEKLHSAISSVDPALSTMARPPAREESAEPVRSQLPARAAPTSATQTALLKFSQSMPAPKRSVPLKVDDPAMTTARRVPIPDAGVNAKDGNTSKPLIRPISFAGRHLSASASSSRPSDKAAASSTVVVVEKGKELSRSTNDRKKVPPKTYVRPSNNAIKPIRPLLSGKRARLSIGTNAKPGSRSQGKEAATRSVAAQLSRTKAKMIMQSAKTVPGRGTTGKSASVSSRPKKEPTQSKDARSADMSKVASERPTSSSALPPPAPEKEEPEAQVKREEAESSVPRARCQQGNEIGIAGKSTQVDATSEAHQPMLRSATPERKEDNGMQASPERMGASTLDPPIHNTPISSLLTSIQRGFLPTPSTPLSPPQSYLDYPSAEITGTMFGVRPLIAGRHKSHTETGECQDSVFTKPTVDEIGGVLRDVNINT